MSGLQYGGFSGVLFCPLRPIGGGLALLVQGDDCIGRPHPYDLAVGQNVLTRHGLYAELLDSPVRG